MSALLTWLHLYFSYWTLPCGRDQEWESSFCLLPLTAFIFNLNIVYYDVYVYYPMMVTYELKIRHLYKMHFVRIGRFT